MNQKSARRSAGLILALSAVLGASAAPAQAASATITGDTGAPVPLDAGMTIRHMAPDISFTLGSGEYYAARVVGPGGTAASSGTSCISTAFPERVSYQGNGTYTLMLKSGNSRDACEAAAEQSVAFVINASTAVAQPERQPLLTREPGKSTLINYDVPVGQNPGADSYEFRYAKNAVLGPDGGITGGTVQSAFVNSSTGIAGVTFSTPGRYTLVVRAKSSRSEVPTAWSPRVDVSVVAPFDLINPHLSDSRGPTYAVRGALRESSARGRVTISIGKGRNAKRFRRLGSTKIGKGGRFKFRFRMRGTGNYTIRFSYRGSSTVSAGTLKYPIRFFRI